MEPITPNASDLRALEFLDIASWQHGELPGRLAYASDNGREDQFAVLTTAPNALYAFVCGEDVMYIGKTARTIKARFMGYRFPGASQTTNIRCNQRIRELIDRGKSVRILVLAPTSSLQWGSFALDLAAGLEDSLIRHFQPPWNGKDRMLTETAELEEIATEAEGTDAQDLTATQPHRVSFPDGTQRFTIKLLPTYFERGLLNPGTEASKRLGDDGDLVKVVLGQEGSIISKLNRTANVNGSVRVVGNNSLIADFFQRHFRAGDVAEGRVIDRSTILLLEPGM